MKLSKMENFKIKLTKTGIKETQMMLKLISEMKLIEIKIVVMKLIKLVI